MFDILGFKALRCSLETAGLYTRLKQLVVPLMQHAAAGRGKIIDGPMGSLFVPDFHAQSVEYRIISDTIILISKDDTFQSFLNIINSCVQLLKFGFAGSKTPYRGAIGWGDVVLDGPHILVGEAVEDAHAGESCQAWAGCMLTPACEAFVIEHNYLYDYFWGVLHVAEQEAEPQKQRKAVDLASLIAHYPVPIQVNRKNEPKAYATREAYVLDWTIGMFEGAAAKAFHQSSEPHVMVLQQNTIEFEAWARKNNRRGFVGPLVADVAGN